MIAPIGAPRSPEMQAIWEDGYDAAMRHGRYRDAKSVPRCPHPDNTEENDVWSDGFGTGTDDLIGPPE